MGWSEKTRQLDVQKVLSRHGIKFSVTKPDTAEPTVRINIDKPESQLPPKSMREVESFFPDNVYVWWEFDVTFSEQEKQDTQEVKDEPAEDSEVESEPIRVDKQWEDLTVDKGMDFEPELH